MMRKTALAALAAMLAGTATAQPATTAAQPPADMWAYLRFADGAMGWNLEAGRWFDNNDTVEGQRLLYFANPEDVDGQKIVWVQEFWRIRCKANTYQIKSGEELNAGLGTLFTLREGQPYPIAANSPQALLKRVYCDNVEIGGQHANGIIEVMDAMKRPAQ